MPSAHPHTLLSPANLYVPGMGYYSLSLWHPLSQEGGVVEDLPWYLAELSQVSSVPSFGPGSAL